MPKIRETRVVRTRGGKWKIEEYANNFRGRTNQSFVRPSWGIYNDKEYDTREDAARDQERLSKMTLTEWVSEVLGDPLDAVPY